MSDTNLAAAQHGCIAGCGKPLLLTSGDCCDCYVGHEIRRLLRERDEARGEVKAGAAMLARQCDMARDAEQRRDDALRDYAEVHEERKRLRAALEAVLAWGVEHDDPRVGYLVVQVDRAAEREAREALAAGDVPCGAPWQVQVVGAVLCERHAVAWKAAFAAAQAGSARDALADRCDALEATIRDLTRERDNARAIARVLASAYEADSRPPIGMVREALAFPVRP